MTRRAILILLLTASCAGPSVLRRAPSGDLQPLDPGLEWTYEANGRVQVRRTAGLERIGRFECRIVESRTGDVVERSWMRWDSDGLKVHRVSDGSRIIDFEDPLLLIRRSAAPGATWSFQERHGPLTLAVEGRYERDENVAIGDREWRCARIRLVKRAAGRVVVDQTAWYAKEIGLVRQTVTIAEDEGETSTTLGLRSCNFLPE